MACVFNAFRLSVPKKLPPQTTMQHFSRKIHLRPFTFYDKTVEEYAQKPFHALSIKHLVEFGRELTANKLLSSARYLHRELPIRLARPIRSMQSLPYIILVNPHIKQVYDTYWLSFQQLRNFPPINTLEDEKSFNDLLSQLVTSHSDTINSLSKGLNEIFLLPNSLDVNFKKLDEFMDRFLIERISRRMLAEQHMAYHKPEKGWVGIIDLSCSPAKIVMSCMKQVQEISQRNFGMHPEVEISGDTDFRMVYIPAHLSYMLTELFKNSVRAVVETHKNKGKLPKINVRLCVGDGEGLTIRISDQGGGIPKQFVYSVWSYGYTSVTSAHPDRANFMKGQSEEKRHRESEGQSVHSEHGLQGVQSIHIHNSHLHSSHSSHSHSHSRPPSNSNPFPHPHSHHPHSHHPHPHPHPHSHSPFANAHQEGFGLGASNNFGTEACEWDLAETAANPRESSEMAGYGFGLPMTRLYAKYMGGDLDFYSMPGYGTDTYLTVKSIADQTEQIYI